MLSRDKILSEGMNLEGELLKVCAEVMKGYHLVDRSATTCNLNDGTCTDVQLSD